MLWRSVNQTEATTKKIWVPSSQTLRHKISMFFRRTFYYFRYLCFKSELNGLGFGCKIKNVIYPYPFGDSFSKTIFFCFFFIVKRRSSKLISFLYFLRHLYLEMYLYSFVAQLNARFSSSYFILSRKK